MSDYNFHVDIDNASCSINIKNLNPFEMIELSNRLRNNAKMILKSKKWKPADVMANTMRMKNNTITFRLAYDAPELTIDMKNPEIPAPNVELSDSDYAAYADLYKAVVS